MAIQRTPPPAKAPPARPGLGCYGCGCLLLVAILLVVIGLVGGLAYFGYKEIYASTSTAPSAVPPFNGSDDIYKSALAKTDAFNKDVAANKASSLTLTSDELNSLIARDPNLTQRNIRLLADLKGDEARLQGTLPMEDLGWMGTHFFSSRYLNFDATFGLVFNAETRHIGTNLHKLQFGDTTVPDGDLALADQELSVIIDAVIQRIPEAKSAVATARTIAIRNGQFVIETK